MSSPSRKVAGAAGENARVLRAGLVAGVLDLCLALGIQFLVAGRVSLVRILQAIAAGVLGPASREGGLSAALLGLVAHFVIATIWAALWFFAATRSVQLRRFTHRRETLVACGLAYGVVVWMGMNLLVVPASRAPSNLTFTLVTALMIVGHALLVGLPIVWTIGAVRHPNDDAILAL